MSIVNKTITLVLNDYWMPVGQVSVADAIVNLASDVSDYLGIDIGYETNPDGTPNISKVSYMNPVNWENWIKLPVRPGDESVRSVKLTIRAPTVIIAKNCKKMPKKRFRDIPSKEGAWIRDGGIDQYTGKKLRKEDASLDHVLPRSKGGKDTWENIAITHKDINREKGNRLNSEVGLKLLRHPKKPADIDLSLTIRRANHPDWKNFLIVNDD